MDDHRKQMAALDAKATTQDVLAAQRARPVRRGIWPRCVGRDTPGRQGSETRIVGQSRAVRPLWR